MVSRGSRRASRFTRWAARALRTPERNVAVWKRLIVTSFVVTLIVSAAHTWHLLDGIENRWLDLMANVDRPELDAPITVVAITDADYYDPGLFGGMSPLDPDALARVLQRVLDHHPSGVILDVQIHPAIRESLERAHARRRLYRMLDSTAAAGGPPIVLVRDIEAEDVERTPDDTMRAAWRALTASPRLIWADPTIGRLGGRVRALPGHDLAAAKGAPALPTVLGAAVAAFGLVPHRSTPWWVVAEGHSASPWRIRFTGLFLNDTLAVTAHRTDVRALLSTPVVAGQRSLLTDRIVLVGGTYHAGRDLQATVVGNMAGVYVWAEAIASWIRHDALREPRAPITFALEFLVGVVAGLLLIRSGPAFGLLYSLLIVGPLTVAFSLLTFGNRVLFVNFLPSFVGVYLHYQIEVHQEIRHLRERLRLTERADLPADGTGRARAHPTRAPRRRPRGRDAAARRLNGPDAGP
jgi:CHASE2 domain-containing sensor protein